MDMEPVQSECLSAVGYDPDAQKLRLQFRSGGTHDYDGVPPEVHQSLMAAESLGQHFHRNIRARFTNRKVA